MSKWATPNIAMLKRGEPTIFKPKGHSMTPRIYSGQRVRVVPVDEDEVKKGCVVLCEVNGSHYLHLVRRVNGKKGKNLRFQISNIRGKVNGTIGFDKIFGILDEAWPSPTT